MLIYVTHDNIEQAKAITRDLQVADLDNCYISPLIALQHLRRYELAYSSEMNLRLDLLSVCDKLLVACDYISEDINEEIEFAELVGMEVDYLD